jgi:hypothetical protein
MGLIVVLVIVLLLQVVTDPESDAKRAMRGAYAETLEANLAYIEFQLIEHEGRISRNYTAITSLEARVVALEAEVGLARPRSELP